MKIRQLAKLATKHVYSAMAEASYLKTGYDMTRPVAIYAMVTHRCNSKCLYCDFWRRDPKQELSTEMTIEQWQSAFLSLKEFIGNYHIELSGGEPFCKKDFIKIPEFLHEHGIIWGLTTNGLYINQDRAQRLVASGPFNINMSIDSPDAAMHDYLRGYDGALAKTTEAIRLLQKERDIRRMMFPIIIKPTMTVRNMKMMPDMVRFARDMGVVCNIQPLNRWTPETYTDDLWIGQERMGEVQAIVDELLKMKADGYPLLTHERVLKLFPDHFMDRKAPKEAMPCRVGMRNFFINPNGDVRVCFFYPAIGNLTKQSAREIWYGPDGSERRKETVACEELCLFTCLSQKTMTDKVKMGLKLLGGRRSAARSREDMANRKPTEFVASNGKSLSLPILQTGHIHNGGGADDPGGEDALSAGEASLMETELQQAAHMAQVDMPQ